MDISVAMVIDDAEADQFLAKVILRKFDPTIKVLKAYDGEEALAILAELEKQPDVIFLDVNMPRMNGYQFLEEYEKWETQGTIVMMLTSSEQNEDKEKSLKSKYVKRFFTKPLNQSILKEISEL